MKAEIICGKSEDVLVKMASESIPCVVTSPPYDDLRTYQGHAWDFSAIAFQLERVLSVGGVICWNVGDSVVNGGETLNSFRQALHFQSLGLRVHDTMIYEKSNGSKPDPHRYNSCFEYIFIFSKGRPRCFHPIKDKKNVTAGKPCFGKHTMREKDGSMTVRNDRKVAAEFGTRSNVWKGNTRGQEDCGKALGHPAMMPQWLAHDLILSFSNPGDIILDPFAGSGTTGSQALKLARNTILIDSNPEYVKLCEQSCHITHGML